MGEGVIDFAPPTEASASAGYTGDIEVEIFNADVWATDPDEVLTKVKASFSEFVGEGRADPATGSATNGAFQREENTFTGPGLPLHVGVTWQVLVR